MITTPEGTLFFPAIAEARTYKGKNAKYSGTLCFPDEADLTEITDAVERALDAKFDKRPDDLKMCYGEDGLESDVGFPHARYLRVSAATRPAIAIVGEDLQGLSERMLKDASERFVQGSTVRARFASTPTRRATTRASPPSWTASCWSRKRTRTPTASRPPTSGRTDARPSHHHPFVRGHGRVVRRPGVRPGHVRHQLLQGPGGRRMSDTNITPVIALGCVKTIMDGRKLEQHIWDQHEMFLETSELWDDDSEAAEEEADRLARLAEIAGDAWRDIADVLIKHDDAKTRPRKAPPSSSPATPCSTDVGPLRDGPDQP